MGETTAQELMNLVEGYSALMKQAERGDATEDQCGEIWEAIRRIAVMLEASAKEEMRLREVCDDLYSDLLAAGSLTPHDCGAYALIQETIKLRRDRWLRKAVPNEQGQRQDAAGGLSD